jgi:hypothetical protein
MASWPSCPDDLRSRGAGAGRRQLEQFAFVIVGMVVGETGFVLGSVPLRIMARQAVLVISTLAWPGVLSIPQISSVEDWVWDLWQL